MFLHRSRASRNIRLLAVLLGVLALGLSWFLSDVGFGSANQSASDLPSGTGSHGRRVGVELPRSTVDIASHGPDSRRDLPECDEVSPRTLVVRVRNVETGELVRDGSIQLVAAAGLEFVPSNDPKSSGHWEGARQVLVSDNASGRSAVVSEEETVPHLLLREGEWRGPVLREDAVVRCVRIGAGYGEIIEGEFIRAGTTFALVSVKPTGFADVRVVDGYSGIDLSNVEIKAVRETKPRPGGALKVSLRFGGDSTGRGVVESEASEPPLGASSLVSSASSPVRLPLAAHDRSLWVRSDGYAWKRVSVPGRATCEPIELERITRLQVRISGSERLRGEYEVHVVRDGESIALWGPNRNDRSFSMSGLSEGVYGLILQHRSGERSVTLYAREHDVRGAGLDLDLDLLDLANALPDPGRLSVLVSRGENAVLSGARLKLYVLPVADDVPSAPWSEVALPSAEVVGEGRSVQFSGLPAGEYLVVLTPCGIRSRVTVESDQATSLSLDLTDLSSVTVWPVDKDGGLLGSPGPQWELHWRPVSPMSDSMELGGVLGTAIGRATWEHDHWRFLSPSGGVRLFVVDGDGEALSSPATHQVRGGPQEISLEVDRSSVCELRLRVRGLDSNELSFLKANLTSSVCGS